MEGQLQVGWWASWVSPVVRGCELPGAFSITPSGHSQAWVSGAEWEVGEGIFQSQVRGSKVRGHTAARRRLSPALPTASPLPVFRGSHLIYMLGSGSSPALSRQEERKREEKSSSAPCSVHPLR